jgi:carbon-monoxide dehydrogenase iron sulfur subunit
MRKKVIDRSRCVGCKNCELACIAVHSTNGSATASYLAGIASAPGPRNKLEKGPDGERFPQFCRHCDSPACVEACMSGALQKCADGYVICDTDRCVGCYMCVMSCPYGNARPSMGPRRMMLKCDGCADRECMACVAACPTGCLSVVDDADDAVEYVEPETAAERSEP